jgi:hypothetical protein
LAVVGGTSTYAIIDSLDDVLARRPDAVLVAAGHDEYYGSFGVMDEPSLVGSPRLARLLIRFDRSRLLRVLRRATPGKGTASPRPEASMYPIIEYASPRYKAGLAQFGDNLDEIVARLQRARVRPLLAIPVSNLRDQQPLAERNRTPNRAARGAFGTGVATLQAVHEALARGDSARAAYELAAARRAFARARDLDPVRLRAPSAFDSIVRAVAQRRGVTVVESEQVFEQNAEDGIPGRDLFVNHVRLSPRGAVLLGRAVCDAIAQTPGPVQSGQTGACGSVLKTPN